MDLFPMFLLSFCSISVSASATFLYTHLVPIFIFFCPQDISCLSSYPIHPPSFKHLFPSIKFLWNYHLSHMHKATNFQNDNKNPTISCLHPKFDTLLESNDLYICFYTKQSTRTEQTISSPKCWAILAWIKNTYLEIVWI